MRSRLVKESLAGLPRTNRDSKCRPKPSLCPLAVSPAVGAFFVIPFVSLGLSLVIFSGLHRFWYPHRPTAANSVLSRFASKPPLVDHTILEKISSLDLEDEDEPDSESETDHSIPINIKPSYDLSPFQRLPRVTHIPEVQPQALPDIEMEGQNRSRLEGNADQVPPSRKFLLPVKIEGQAVNAQVHLMQLLELARALNRTLVLPNVGNNRVGACGRWRFGVYYDEQALRNKANGDPNAFIRPDRFRAWVNSLASPPKSRLVFLDQTYQRNFPQTAFDEHTNDSLGLYIYDNPDTTTLLHGQRRCLIRKFPQLDLIDTFPPLSFMVDNPRREERNRSNISQMFLKKLSELILTAAPSEPVMDSTSYGLNHAHVSPDVLAVFWNIPIPIFQPHPTEVIYHSPQLRALAARLVRRLGPYIAVIWDVESSKADSVLDCVEALRSTLRHVLSDHERLGIGNIWLARNLSPSDLVYSSEAFCISTFTEELYFASGVELTGARQELARMVRKGEEVDDLANNGDEGSRKQELLDDAGVLEILDKLVSMRSTILVTASKSCGKTRYGLASLAYENWWD